MLQARSIFQFNLVFLKLGGSWLTYRPGSSKILVSFFDNSSFFDESYFCFRGVSNHLEDTKLPPKKNNAGFDGR